MKAKLLYDKRHALIFFRAGKTVYMVDFEQADQRNMCRRITNESMITEDKIRSENVFFYVMLGE